MGIEERYDLIQYLVGKLSDVGKVKIQKILYFIQEACGVNLGYDFAMHYYGPYSDELNSTLQEMKLAGILRFSLVLYASYYGYDIKLGENARKEVELSPPIREKTDKIVSIFNKYDAKMMELLSSIHFVRSILMGRKESSDSESVLNEVQKLKPKFSKGDIQEAYRQLQENELLETACSSMP